MRVQTIDQVHKFQRIRHIGLLEDRLDLTAHCFCRTAAQPGYCLCPQPFEQAACNFGLGFAELEIAMQRFLDLRPPEGCQCTGKDLIFGALYAHKRRAPVRQYFGRNQTFRATLCCHFL